MALDLQALHQQLIEHEGLRLKLYSDSRGIPTIGVGRNLRDVGISLAEAMELLDHDVAAAIGALDTTFPWFQRLEDVRQRVLIDMCVNLGRDGLLGFHQMLDACRRGDYEDAAREMLDSTWAEQVGARAIRLAKMMRTGQAPA